jgi:hypothetical protein
MKVNGNIQNIERIFHNLNITNNGIRRVTENKIKNKFLKRKSVTNKFRLNQYSKNRLSPQIMNTIREKYFLILVYTTGKKNKEHNIIVKKNAPPNLIGPIVKSASVNMSIPVRL